EGHYRDCVRPAFRGRVRALERVDRDVDGGTVAAADLLADVEHRRFVTLALADDDRPIEAGVFHAAAHRFDRGLIGGVVVAVTHAMRRGDRGRLRDAHELEAGWTVARDPLERRRDR